MNKEVQHNDIVPETARGVSVSGIQDTKKPPQLCCSAETMGDH